MWQRDRGDPGTAGFRPHPRPASWGVGDRPLLVRAVFRTLERPRLLGLHHRCHHRQLCTAGSSTVTDYVYFNPLPSTSSTRSTCGATSISATSDPARRSSTTSSVSSTPARANFASEPSPPGRRRRQSHRPIVSPSIPTRSTSPPHPCRIDAGWTAPAVGEQHDDDHQAIDDLTAASGICITDSTDDSSVMRMAPTTVPA